MTENGYPDSWWPTPWDFTSLDKLVPKDEVILIDANKGFGA